MDQHKIMAVHGLRHGPRLSHCEPGGGECPGEPCAEAPLQASGATAGMGFQPITTWLCVNTLIRLQNLAIRHKGAVVMHGSVRHLKKLVGHLEGLKISSK